MGCSHTLNQSSFLSGTGHLSSLDQSLRVLWYDIRNYNFETKNFEPLVLFQTAYCDSKGKMISPYLASVVVLELKRFFFLSVLCIQDHQKLGKTQQLPDVSELVPPPLVDRLWRLLMTNTEAYELFSLSMFDCKLQRDGRKFLDLDKYRQTRKLMKSIFGPVNPMIWPDFVTSPALQLAHKGFVLMERELIPSFYDYMNRKISKTKSTVALAIHKLEEIRRKQALRNYPNDAESSSLSMTNTFKEIDTDEDNPSDEEQDVSAKFVGFKEIAPPFPKKMMLLMDCERIDALTAKLESMQLEEVKDVHSQIPSLKSSKLNNEEELHEQAQILIESMTEHPIPAYIIRGFSNQICIPLPIAETIFDEYKRFLILHYLGTISSRFIYPPLVKRAWDYHLAQSAEYESFCQYVFKEFLIPPLLPRKITASEMHDYDETLLAYQNLFEQYPPQGVWTSSALRFIAEDKAFMHIGSFIHERQTEEQLLAFYGLKEVEKATSEMETLSETFA